MTCLRITRACARRPMTKGTDGGFLSARRSVAGSLTALLGLAAVLTLGGPALAQQNPCSERGPDCRPLASAEINALKERLLALRAALPVPDPDRWAPPPDVGEPFTLPFVAELNLGGAMVSGSWPAGAFTELNEVHFLYDGVTKPAAKPKDTQDALAQIEQMQAAIGNRIEVLAKLLPHAFLVSNVNGNCVDVSDPEATRIEKTATFLSWESNGGTLLTIVFGPRTCKEVETERLQTPAPALAPVKSITLEISVPNKAEMAALKKKIDRKAFEALLGPVTK
jgi:hypothetical protein